jgi:hypothetical protein
MRARRANQRNDEQAMSNSCNHGFVILERSLNVKRSAGRRCSTRSSDKSISVCLMAYGAGIYDALESSICASHDYRCMVQRMKKCAGCSFRCRQFALEIFAAFLHN